MSSYRARQPGASLARILFYELIRKSAHLILAVFFGARAIDRRNVPAVGPLLLASNHESYLDPPVIASLMNHRHLEFIARAGLFKFRPFASIIALLNSIPIREDQGDGAAIREVLRRLDMGRAVLIFPEGSRSPDGTMQPFKRGVSLLVKRSKCPVVPVAIAGAHECWPRHRWPRLFGPPIIVKYGVPIPHDELMKDGPDAALERLFNEIKGLRDGLHVNGRE